MKTAQLHSIIKEIKSAAQQSPRIYFAPLMGAIQGVKSEIKRVQRKSGTYNIRSSHSADINGVQ